MTDPHMPILHPPQHGSPVPFIPIQFLYSLSGVVVDPLLYLSSVPDLLW